jgi:type II secretory pathway component GspD/PulD (secretin)
MPTPPSWPPRCARPCRQRQRQRRHEQRRQWLVHAQHHQRHQQRHRLGSGTSSSAGLGSGSGLGAGAGSSNTNSNQPSTGGQIQADPTTNSLIITAPEPQYRQLRAVIDKLDGRRAQVLVESLIVEVTASKLAEFGIQWQGTMGSRATAWWA